MTGENVAHRHQIFSQLNFSSLFTRTIGLQILECIGQELIESLRSDAEIVDENQIISGVFVQRTFRFKGGGFSCVERVY